MKKAMKYLKYLCSAWLVLTGVIIGAFVTYNVPVESKEPLWQFGTISETGVTHTVAPVTHIYKDPNLILSQEACKLMLREPNGAVFMEVALCPTTVCTGCGVTYPRCDDLHECKEDPDKMVWYYDGNNDGQLTCGRLEDKRSAFICMKCGSSGYLVKGEHLCGEPVVIEIPNCYKYHQGSCNPFSTTYPDEIECLSHALQSRHFNEITACVHRNQAKVRLEQ